MEVLWGSRRTRNKIVSDFFAVIQGDNHIRQFSAYEPYDFLGEVLLEFLSDPRPIDLIRDGKRLSLPRKPILSRAAGDHVANAKHAAWDVYPSPTLPINEQALLDFSKITPDQNHGLNALRLARMARNTLCPGAIPLLYEQKATGRLTEMLWAIQSTPREVMSAALTGYTDADLQNAHFSIFSQWAKRLGHLTPNVDEYISNKRKIRNELATHCGANADDIKQCLISLMYGAPLSSNPDFAKIPEILGQQAARLFTTHEFVRGLKREIAKVAEDIVNDLPVHRGRYGNALGVYVPRPTKKNANTSLLCHALQGVEALALKTIVEHYGQDILLCMHDGWISRHPLNLAEAEDLIERATGFRLSIEAVPMPKHLPARGPRTGLPFASSEPIDPKGFWVSNSPKWAAQQGVVGRVTRTDLI